MRIRTSLLVVVAALALAPLAPAQCFSLTTTYLGNNGQSGNMFDIVAAAPVTISTFDVNAYAGTYTFEIYVCNSGSYMGHDANPASWTLIATIPGVVGLGVGTPTPLPVNLGFPISPGATQGFYVTVAGSTGLKYTDGTTEGAVYATDPFISILEGIGKAYPFGLTFNPRIWNGTVYYQSGGSAGDYQMSQPTSSLTVNGAVDLGPCRDMVFTFQAASPFSLDLGSTLSGNPFDLAYTPGTGTVALSAGGFPLVDGQIINLDINAVQLLFAPSLPPFVGPHSIYLTAPAVPAPVTVGVQQVVVDPTSMIGFWLSRAVEINFN